MLLSKLIKEFRESKLISQAKLSHGILSPQHLSHFENNHNSMKAINYFSIIKSLNIAISEIDFYLQWYHSQDELMSAIQESISLNDDSNIIELTHDQQMLFKENNYSIHQHNLVILYQNLHKYFDHPSNKDYQMQVITNYLLNTTVWHSYELYLLEAIIHFVSESQLRTLFETGKTRLSSNIDMSAARKKIAQLYILTINQSLSNHAITDTEFFIDKFKVFLSKKTLLNAQVICLFQEGALLIQKDEETLGMTKVSKALDMMKFAGDLDAYKEYSEILNII